jgi:hypothetical protein
MCPDQPRVMLGPIARLRRAAVMSSIEPQDISVGASRQACEQSRRDSPGAVVSLFERPRARKVAAVVNSEEAEDVPLGRIGRRALIVGRPPTDSIMCIIWGRSVARFWLAGLIWATAQNIS